MMLKKVMRDKLLIFKVVIYSAYIVLSCKKAVACFRLLINQIKLHMKQKQSSAYTTSQTLLCVLYLALIVVQLFVFSTEEIRYLYKVVKQKLRLVCYEITFKNKDNKTSVIP